MVVVDGPGVGRFDVGRRSLWTRQRCRFMDEGGFFDEIFFF